MALSSAASCPDSNRAKRAIITRWNSSGYEVKHRKLE